MREALDMARLWDEETKRMVAKWMEIRDMIVSESAPEADESEASE